MKKHTKEIIAIAIAEGFAYSFQLFVLLMCYISSPNTDFITPYSFIPMFGIQIIVVPLIAWTAMGLLHVSWYKHWFCITICAMAFLIPFGLICGTIIMIMPALVHETVFWIVSISVSFVLSFTLFKPLLKECCC